GHSVWLKQVSGRVCRRIYKDRLSSRSNRSFYSFRPVLKTVFLIHRDHSGDRFEETHEIRMAGVMGIGQNYLFPAFQKGAHSYQEGRGCPGCNYYPIGVDASNSVSLLIIVADSLAQSGGSEAMRIV